MCLLGIMVQYRSNVSWQSRLETQFSVLEVFENRVLRLKFGVSIFEVREPSFKDQVSSFETLEEFFEDLEQRFRGNDLILKNKTIAMNKAIDERLYSRKLTRCWMYANIFSCCAFSTRHMRFAYLHWSWWQQTSLASKCVYNVSCRNEWLFFARLQPGASVLFSFARLQPAAQNVNKH